MFLPHPLLLLNMLFQTFQLLQHDLKTQKHFFNKTSTQAGTEEGISELPILLTHSVNKELWFGWKIVVDHVVQHGNIDSTGLV